MAFFCIDDMSCHMKNMLNRELVCSSCGQIIETKAESKQCSIECEICTKWFHLECEELSDEAWEAMDALKLLWMRKAYKKFVDKFREVVAGKE